MAEVTCTIRIHGLVQGVWYRASTVEEARRLGLGGIVRNLPDGSVEAVATGPRDRLDALIAWCRQGPPAARVDTVDVTWHQQPTAFDSFRAVR
ncbi:MAG: acylphosphatase [Deltaproteobacteria bacterium]|nr:acylphosphatase [Deltaproteobacteria bacterium]